MGIPRIYRKSGERSITTFDYFDIAEGTGIVKFFGSNHIDTSGTTYFLSTRINFAGSINTQEIPVGGFAKKLDLDFDITFNIPKRIKGDIILILTNTAKGGADADTTSYLIVKTKKNTTQIGSSVQTTTLSATAGQVNSQMNNIKINVPNTHFKKGDILRITIEVWGAYSGSGGEQRVGLTHDPKDRDDSALLLDIHSSTMEVQVPFLIDL